MMFSYLFLQNTLFASTKASSTVSTIYFYNHWFTESENEENVFYSKICAALTYNVILPNTPIILTNHDKFWDGVSFISNLPLGLWSTSYIPPQHWWDTQFVLDMVQTHWRAWWSQNDILYRIKPTSFTMHEKCITIAGQITFLVHFTILRHVYEFTISLFGMGNI